MSQFDLATKIVLIMHKREQVKVTATGPLALECLSNSELLIHGHRASPVDLSIYNQKDRRLLILYPREGAAVLNDDFIQADDRPITLLVPDGNWRQASKMGRRLPGVEHATNVMLPPGQRTQWGLRNEPQEGGLATFEAIARSLGIIESQEVQKKMETLFDTMVARTVKLRGRVRHW